MANDPEHGRVLTRYSVEVLTRALEDAVLRVGAEGEPVAVLSIFQHGRWFAGEFERYQALGDVATVLVAFGDAPPAVPDAIASCLIDKPELASEWSFVVASPRLAAALVTRDRRRGDASPAHAFVGGWTFRRHEALTEADRILHALGDAVDDDTSAALGKLLDAARAAPTEHPLTAPLPRREHPNEPFLATAAAQLIDHLEATQGQTRRLLRRLAAAVDDTDRDPLTLLHNRRHLEELLRERDASDEPASWVIISVEVNGMTSVNSERGQEAGDLVLAHVGGAIADELRGSDVPVRWGGDEFVAVLENATVDTANEVAGRLRTAIARPPTAPEIADLKVSVSIGVAQAGSDRSSFEAVESALEQTRNRDR